MRRSLRYYAQYTNCVWRSRSNERERQALQNEKERAHNALRTHEKDLSDMQLREVNLNSQLKDRTMLEKQAEEMKTEVTTASQSFKVKSVPLIVPPPLDYAFAEPCLL